jgi:D-amino-acid dehydrogenase
MSASKATRLEFLAAYPMMFGRKTTDEFATRIKGGNYLTSPDVVVVGGGAIGAAIAYELTQSGAKVTLVEREGHLAAGCSLGNAGMIRTDHAQPLATPAAVVNGVRWMLKRDSPFSLRPRPSVLPWLARFTLAATPSRVRRATTVLREMSLLSFDLHNAYVRSGIATGFTRSGVLDLFETPSAFAAGKRLALQANGNGRLARVLDPHDLKEVVPSIRPTVVGGVLYSNESYCEPVMFTESLAHQAGSMGASIQLGVAATALERRGSRVVAVQTNAGRIAAGEVVLAAGVWSVNLARPLGVSLPIQPGKGYHVEYQRAAADPTVPFLLNEAHVTCTPMSGALRFAGSFELSGMDLRIAKTRIEAIKLAADRVLNQGSRSTITRLWSGLRPCTPDGLPILGRPRRVTNLMIASGHGMQGVQLAPATGRLVAEMVRGGATSMNPGPMRPDRFVSFAGI